MIDFYERWFIYFDFEEIFTAPHTIDNKREVYMCLAEFFTKLTDIRTLEVKKTDQAIVMGNIVVSPPDAIGPNAYFMSLCQQSKSITSILNRCERDSGYSYPDLLAEINRRLQHLVLQLKPITNAKKFTG